MDDIIAELVEDEDSERIATGVVDGMRIELQKTHFRDKSQEKQWEVVAEAPDSARWRTKETFPTAKEADYYFEELLDRYDLSEGPKELLEVESSYNTDGFCGD